MSKYIRLKDFTAIELDPKFLTKVNRTLEKGANRCKRAIVRKSPVGKNHRAHKYSQTWDVYTNEKTLTATIYNKENYRLTHLLENGHFIVTQKRKLIWVAPRPHIAPAFDETKDKLIQDMEKIDIDVEFK